MQTQKLMFFHNLGSLNNCWIRSHGNITYGPTRLGGKSLTHTTRQIVCASPLIFCNPIPWVMCNSKNNGKKKQNDTCVSNKYCVGLCHTHALPTFLRPPPCDRGSCRFQRTTMIRLLLWLKEIGHWIFLEILIESKEIFQMKSLALW
jgi:hypothetical protein